MEQRTSLNICNYIDPNLGIKIQNSSRLPFWGKSGYRSSTEYRPIKKAILKCSPCTESLALLWTWTGQAVVAVDATFQ